MSEPFIAQIMPFAGNFAPRGWAFCDGQLMAISQNTALFSLIGTTYGGDGKTTFALPDLRGRSCLHAGRMPGGSNYNLGQRGGSETVTLSSAQMPSHGHTAKLRCNPAPADGDDPSGATLATTGSDIYQSGAATTDMAPSAISVANTGGSQAHENRPPFLVVSWCIALVGLFPSRS